MSRPWHRLLEIPWVYRLWQTPFAERKLAPVWRHADLDSVRRVLDVACGPGTNAPHFRDKDYLGIDLNAAYVARARARHGMRFEVADATTWRGPDGGFDLILVNSFLHHVDDAAAERILAHLSTLLAPGGHVHVLDLVLPDRPSPARLLARLDRGEHPRPLGAWRSLLRRDFEEEAFEPYDLGLPGLPLWRMVHFQGRARR